MAFDCGKESKYMGNYYMGRLQFYLKKDISPADLNDLNMITEMVDDQGKYSEKIQKSNWFRHERWNAPVIELYKMYAYDEKGLYRAYAFDDYGNRQYLLHLMESEADEEGLIFVGYELDMRISMKGYRKDGNDFGEAVVEYLKPMCDDSLFDDESGTIGRVYDEDETYNREFHLNEKAFQKEIEKRSFLCNGCRFELKLALCEDWKKCFRAYGLGKVKE